MDQKHCNTIATAGVVTRDALMAELGIGDDTMRAWEKAGLPYINLNRQFFYSTTTVVSWLLKHQRKGRA